MTPTYHQINVGFPDWTGAEQTAVTHLAPLLTTARADDLITSWFFVRKSPHWRVRYLPTNSTSLARTRIHDGLDALKHAQHITCATDVVYEPETHAFGGPEAMAVAHRLWHLDSRHVLSYLATTDPTSRRRRELSILLYSAMLRAAGLDWYEQGDTWARVAEHRERPNLTTDELHSLQDPVRRLMNVEPAGFTYPAAATAAWADAFRSAGRDLVTLAAEGLLHRGLRAVLAHHIVFAWNRFGLPGTTQAILANTAKAVVFGRDPTSLESKNHAP